jgi:hypothetical protein
MPEEPLENWGSGVEDLWRTAESSSSEALDALTADSGGAFPSCAAWEALSLVRQKSRKESRELAKLLSVKYKALEESRERERILQSQLQQLKRNLAEQKVAVLQESLEMEVEIEKALKTLGKERAQ